MEAKTISTQIHDLALEVGSVSEINGFAQLHRWNTEKCALNVFVVRNILIRIPNVDDGSKVLLPSPFSR